MFTGLIEATGVVLSIKKSECVHEQSRKAYASLRIGCPHIVQSGIAIGDSICVNGVCLTVVRQSPRAQRLAVIFTKNPQHAWFEVEMLATTLEKTSLSSITIGKRVNLERALRASHRMGGHFVTGHVACVAQITSLVENEENCFLTAEIPKQYMKYMIREGSIALDGISLTVAEISEGNVTCCIIPHTKTATNLHDIKEGDIMNVEPDIIARYIENMVRHDKNMAINNETIETAHNVATGWSNPSVA